MNTIILISSDDGLASRVMKALVGEEQLVRWKLGDDPQCFGEPATRLVVVDCRKKKRAELTNLLAHVRANFGSESRCVAIASRAGVEDIEILSTNGIYVTGLIFSETDPLADVLRAELNDPTRTAAAAIALGALLKRLPAPAHPLLSAVLGSGLRASSVKEVAATWGQDRGTVTRHIRQCTAFEAKELVDFAKASYVAVLLRGSTLPIRTIMKVARYSEPRRLDKLLQRVFGLSVQEVRHSRGSQNPATWLSSMLRKSIRRLPLACD